MVAMRLVIASLVGVILGSIVQTQINLVALVALGATIPVGPWLATTLHDLATFAPIYAAMFVPGFVVAQLLSRALLRYVGSRFRLPLAVSSAMLALWVTFKVVDAFSPMPTLIAATRGLPGLFFMLASAGVAGAMFAALGDGARRRPGQPRVAGWLAVIAVAGLVGNTPPLRAQTADAAAEGHTSYRIDAVSEGLEHPWSIAFLPDRSMLVTERPGRIRWLEADGRTRVASLAGVPEVYASGQSGLFDIVLSPTFDADRELFLSYACGTASANHTCLARAILGTEGLEDVRVVFRAQPAKAGNAHFGGRLAWMDDGTLLLSLGDGFDYREQAQNPATHIGSIVRLKRDGSAPDDNPFVDDATARPEIYSIGHRNVQGLVFDAANQRVIMHEHGPRGGDEINIIDAGANYGWPLVTNGLDYTFARVTPFTTYPGTVAPLLDWTPSIGPSGLMLYRGAMFPQWQGNLLLGSLVNREVRRVTLSGDGKRAEDVEGLFGELEQRIRDVREGPDGAIYLLTDSPRGQLLRVTPAP